MIRPVAVLLALLLALSGGARAMAAGPFSDWAAVVVAGDYRAHDGTPAEIFDNARRDVSAAFEASGFDPKNVREFSVRPNRYPGEHLLLSDPGLIADQLVQLAGQARGGCLVYFSSHGSPAGAVVGKGTESPAGLSRVIDAACGERPTVVIVSACFSGVFVPELAKPNRMILTAARPDRASFGCGSTDRYPYFDACMLQVLPQAADFAVLGREAQACVAQREKDTGMTPPSEPQLFIGAQFRPLIPFYPLHAATGGASGLSPAGGTP